MADEIGNPNWTKSGMADDIVTRLHTPYVEPCICVDVVRAECRSCCDRIDAKAEIVRLRAEVERVTNGNNVMGLLWNAERALADQLAVALLGTASGRIIPTDDEWAGVVKMRSAALDAWEARRG